MGGRASALDKRPGQGQGVAGAWTLHADASLGPAGTPREPVRASTQPPSPVAHAAPPGPRLPHSRHGPEKGNEKER